MKKLVAFAISLGLCIINIIGINSHAVAWMADSTAKTEIFEDYSQIEDYSIFDWVAWTGSGYNEYNTYVNGSNKAYILDFPTFHAFSFELSNETENSESEEILSILEKYIEFDENYDKSFYKGSYMIYDYSLSNETIEVANSICKELKELDLISSFEFYDNVSFLSFVECPYVTAYDGYNQDMELLENYIVENNLDCDLIYVEREDIDFWGRTWCDAYCVVPNSEITLEEHIQIAAQIKRDLGYIPLALSLESTESAYSEVIDLFNAEISAETTTTTASETTTTTTTTKAAAAASTTSKKGVDSPKTGDAGIAGVLLAGAGAVAMAFALRKRED